MDQPAFVRIEYWNGMTQDWEVGHHGIRLVNPAAYVQKLAQRDIIARAVDRETNEIVYTDGGELL